MFKTKFLMLSLIIVTVLVSFIHSPTRSEAGNTYDFDNLEMGLSAVELKLDGVQFQSSDYRVMNVDMVNDQTFIKLHQGILGGGELNTLQMKFAVPQQDYSFVFAVANCGLLDSQPNLTVNISYNGRLIQTDTFRGSVPSYNQWQEGVANHGQIIYNELEIIAPTCTDKSTETAPRLYIDYLETADYVLIYYPDLTSADMTLLAIGHYADMAWHPLLQNPAGDILRDDAGHPVGIEGGKMTDMPGMVILEQTTVKGHIWYYVALHRKLGGWLPAEKVTLLTPLP